VEGIRPKGFDEQLAKMHQTLSITANPCVEQGRERWKRGREDGRKRRKRVNEGGRGRKREEKRGRRRKREEEGGKRG
jgi:hypothetical protein